MAIEDLRILHLTRPATKNIKKKEKLQLNTGIIAYHQHDFKTNTAFRYTCDRKPSIVKPPSAVVGAASLYGPSFQGLQDQ